MITTYLPTYIYFQKISVSCTLSVIIIMDRLDAIVLGATGFTGKYVVKNLAQFKKESKYSNLSWGIAGRSMEKLRDLLKELMESGIDTSTIPVFECDIKLEGSVMNVSAKAKVLMNCTGPNTILSEPVVKACIETRTHYVDISAELHHMLAIYRDYNKAAEDANVLIIPACGFASVPAVAGLMHLENNFNGTINRVDCYTEIGIPKRAYIPGPNKCLVHYGTWASLVHELQNFRQYREMKKETFPNPINQLELEEIKKSFFHRNNGRFWFPYPGPDRDVVEMTQRYLHESKNKRPYHFNIYTTMPLLFHFFIIVPAFFFYYYASYFKCFRNLLWKYPRLFTLGYISHNGPTEKIMNDTKFTFTLTGKGWNENTKDFKVPPNKSLTVKVSGSDPGYGTTSKLLIISALTILKESSKLPKGGVLTSGAAFSDTNFVETLNKYCLRIEII